MLHNEDRKEVKVNYDTPLKKEEKKKIKEGYGNNDATYDNNSTIREINYLIKAFRETKNKEYLKSAEKGIWYVIKGQYPTNGGWPQYYPVREGYYKHITYNDNAMVNCLTILQHVAKGTNGFDVVDPSLVEASKKAVEKGLECILNTQIKVNGKLTVWCAQHDAVSLKPANARAFELVSLSGSESVGIVRFLMMQENPSPEIKAAIKSAVEWFEYSKIENHDFVWIEDPEKPQGKDRIFKPEAGAVIWARFYDIETNEPFFTGRDGIKRKTVAEIEHERRTGYGWYGSWAKKLLDKEYPAWLEKNKD